MTFKHIKIDLLMKNTAKRFGIVDIWALIPHFLRDNKKIKKELPGRESNPGLPRDRRRYLPLYYRGLAVVLMLVYHCPSGRSVLEPSRWYGCGGTRLSLHQERAWSTGSTTTTVSGRLTRLRAISLTRELFMSLLLDHCWTDRLRDTTPACLPMDRSGSLGVLVPSSSSSVFYFCSFSDLPPFLFFSYTHLLFTYSFFFAADWVWKVILVSNLFAYYNYTERTKRIFGFCVCLSLSPV